MSIITEIQLDIGREVCSLVEQGCSTLEMLEWFAANRPNLGLTLDGIERMARQVSDRRPAARRLLEAKSVDMARHVALHGKPSVHVRALEGLGVLQSEDRSSGLTIIVGAGGAVQVNLGDIKQLIDGDDPC